ncbi:MAG: DUF2637 domain-containing protein [Micromonosporaceae bacterium]
MSVEILRRLSAGVIALVAAYASYFHIVAVALRYGERPDVAYILPFAVDALMFLAAATIAQARHTGTKPDPWARAAFWFGLAASLAANIASADPALGGRIVAGAAPVVLLFAVELMWPTRRRTTASPATAEPGAPHRPQTAKQRRQTSRRQHRARAAELVVAAHHNNPTATNDEIAALAGVSPRSVDRHRPKTRTALAAVKN